MFGAGLSLEQAPPYKIPLLFYIFGTVYLILFSLALFLYGWHVENRYYYEAIAITHLLTLGFFTHIMMGTLFQMVPVIIGVSYKNVESRAKIILLFLNLGTLSFVFSFLFGVKMLMSTTILFLSLATLYFSFYSIVTIRKTIDKNATVKSLLTALGFLAVGAVFGVFLILQHGGMFAGFNFGNIHLSFMIYGWIFMLFSGVAYKVIPMFYVAREYPLLIKNYLYIGVSFALFLSLFFSIYEFDFGVKVSKILLALEALVFAVTTITILKKRKRARSDTTVSLWYFSMSNLVVANLLLIISTVFDLELDFAIAVIFGIGFIYALINGMLYKIVPFLTWFHLSSSFVFEAEMSEVIKTKMMKIQFYTFMLSYAFFVLSLFYKPSVFVADTLFFISSSLLLYNLACGFTYHAKMMKKKPILQ